MPSLPDGVAHGGERRRDGRSGAQTHGCPPGRVAHPRGRHAAGTPQEPGGWARRDGGDGGARPRDRWGFRAAVAGERNRLVTAGRPPGCTGGACARARTFRQPRGCGRRADVATSRKSVRSVPRTPRGAGVSPRCGPPTTITSQVVFANADNAPSIQASPSSLHHQSYTIVYKNLQILEFVYTRMYNCIEIVIV